MKRCTKKIRGLGDPYEGSTREISWSPLRYGKNKLGSLPTPTESHRRRIRMKEIEGAHSSRQDYLSNVNPHNYIDLLHAIHITACGSL